MTIKVAWISVTHSEKQVYLRSSFITMDASEMNAKRK